MQQSSRRPPNYPPPAYPPPQTRGTRAPQPPQTPASAARPPVAPAYAPRAQRDIVIRTVGLKLLAVGGTIHASLVLMALVILLVMAAGGDARVGLIMRTIKNASTPLWTWTLCSLAISFVLGSVMLYTAIGTLSLTPWTQRATKIWSTAWLALSCAALVINLGWIYPMLKEASPDRFTFARTLAMTWIHIAAGVIWPAVVLFYMNTRHVKQAYARIAGGASAI